MTLLYFVRSPFTYGFKVTGVYHVSFLSRYSVIAFMLSYSSKRSAIKRFLLICGVGGRVMNLIYGSSSSSYMDCMVFFGEECCISRRSRVRLTPCSCICTSVAGLVIFGNSCGSTTFRMNTRRLPVLLFVSRIEYPFISCCFCCAECLRWPEGAFTLYAYYGMSVI